MTFAEWRSAGAALAPLHEITVLLLIGESPVALAAVARGVASAAPPKRRVAVFDLAGGFGTEEPDGLISAFREGRSLNALARPLDDGASERFVVHKGPGVLDVALASHERWHRLVQGFRTTGALLLVTAPWDFACARALAAHADIALKLALVDGVATLAPITRETPAMNVQIDEPQPNDTSTLEQDPPSDVSTFVEQTPEPDDAPIDGLEPEGADDAERSDDDARLPRTTSSLSRRVRTTPPNPSHSVHLTPRSARSIRQSRYRAVAIGAGIVLLAVASAGGWYRFRGRERITPTIAANADSLTKLDARQISRTDTLPLPEVVNPGDSALAAQWSVELVATNDRADANFRLAEQSTLPAGTISPVVLGGDSAVWFKIVGGAYVERTAAELLRQTLRQMGTIDKDAGVVARLPYAIRLDTALAPIVAKSRAIAYGGRGVMAYALQSDDDHATVYVGAFATPEQSAMLIAELRRAGFDPQLAYRVGRTY